MKGDKNRREREENRGGRKKEEIKTKSIKMHHFRYKTKKKFGGGLHLPVPSKNNSFGVLHPLALKQNKFFIGFVPSHLPKLITTIFLHGE